MTAGAQDPSPSPPLLVSETEGVVVVSLNRPHVRNAIDDALQGDLIAAFERVAAAATARALILTGIGTAFCAGGDVNGMRARLSLPAGQVAVAGWRRLRNTQRMVSTLHDLGVVTIAAVNGPAFGVGMDLALACDVVLASEAAVFASAYTQRGLIPDGGGLYLLPRRVGLARAKDLIFSGRRVTAGAALEIGLADRVVPAAELEQLGASLAAEYAQGSPAAIALAKSILNRTFESTREEVFMRSAQAQAICYTTDEHRASVDAFLNAPKQGSNLD